MKLPSSCGDETALQQHFKQLLMARTGGCAVAPVTSSHIRKRLIGNSKYCSAISAFKTHMNKNIYHDFCRVYMITTLQSFVSAGKVP
jgi:hypothetical protein